MGKRIPASKRTRQRISELMEGRTEGFERSELVRLAAELIIEEALEAEVTDVLGRKYYENGAGDGEGYRNGYRPGKLKTSEGLIRFALPQVSDLRGPYRSRIKEHLKGQSEELEKLAVELFARGLSTRDIEAAFSDQLGQLLLSRSAVSRMTERLWEEYEAFASRDLSEYEPAYLFVDGVAERLRPGQRREAVLVAWCILTDGRKVLLHIMPGSREDTESCRALFQDMKARGLKDPLLVVTDGAPGLIRAVEECFVRSARQRCLAHRMRNLSGKVPEDVWPEFRERARAAYQAPSREIARMLRDDVVNAFGRDLPTAVRCFDDDFEACIAHLRFPVNHRRAIRTTNMLERLFVEERRRLKIIPNAFGERPVLKLMYASLTRASDKWRRIPMSQFEQRQLEAIRQELDQEYRNQNQTKAAGKQKVPYPFSSKNKT
jgi:putative transposase